jgi:hypothetical protein
MKGWFNIPAASPRALRGSFAEQYHHYKFVQNCREGIQYQEMELSFPRGNKVVVAKHISSDTNQPIRYTKSKVMIDA